MKIMFIVGSLAEKKNGVADYVLNLTNSLEKLGHEIAIVALNAQINSVQINDLKNNNKFKISISNKFSIYRKKKIVNQFIQTFKPDLVSLQFVSFSYHQKGLPFNLLSILSGIKHLPLHIMFHELWVDYQNTNNIKKYILGVLQKYCLTLIIKRFNPQIITTTIPYYVSQLLPYKANLLPLFGNIKPIDFINLTKQKNELNIVFFGSFSSNITGFIEQLNWLKTYSNIHKLNVKLNVIGNNGIYKEASLFQIKKILGPHALFVIGQRSVEQVSETFLKADIGISRADYKFFGKSGSTMAMLEHGLPVLLRGEKPFNFYQEELLNNFENQIIFTSSSFENIPLKQNAICRQMQIAENFMSIINTNLSLKK
jgi:hypothetical protein